MSLELKDLQQFHAGSLRQSLVSVFRKTLIRQETKLLHINSKENIFTIISFGIQLRLFIEIPHSRDQTFVAIN